MPQDLARKYVRVYYSVINDERFAEIFHDGRRLGTWLQLLLVADAMYPADAPIPAYVHRPSFDVLVTAGLIEERPHLHFRVHGLSNERAERSQSGRNAAALRWQSERIADPMLAKTSIDKTSTTRAPAREAQSAFDRGVERTQRLIREVRGEP